MAPRTTTFGWKANFVAGDDSFEFINDGTKTWLIKKLIVSSQAGAGARFRIQVRDNGEWTPWALIFNRAIASGSTELYDLGLVVPPGYKYQCLTTGAAPGMDFALNGVVFEGVADLWV